MSANFDFDLFDEMVKDAPVAGFGPQVNYGKCTMTVSIMSWVGEKGNRKPNPRPFVAGATLNKDKGEYFQIEFVVDVHELNSQLENEWKRRVDVKKSNGKKAQTDWSEIVEPSLLKVFGKDWAKKLGGKGVYVEVEAADTVVIDAKTGLPKSFIAASGVEYTNTAPRFLRAFKSKAECDAARQERFAKKDDGDDLSTDDVPADVVNNVKGLFAAMSYEQALAYLDSKPFGNYTPEQLLEAAEIEGDDSE